MSKPSEPYLRDLQFRGVIEGLTYLDKSSLAQCHFFGGIPFGLPPVGPFRFQRPRPLPTCYRYGTRSNPGRFTGSCSLCPQHGRRGLDDELWDEDCLQSNIWVPIGEPPAGGWPVWFYIHGGFLQFGNPNDLDMRALLGDSPTQCIIVAPAYRLNLFGFLGSSELLKACPDYDVNLGFWDQRLALQWTWENISYFGGNPSNITIGGYSAGAHSVFHQLAYDLGVPENKAIVKRAMLLSNGPGLQPKSLEETQTQFNEFLGALAIPLDLAPAAKLARLRALDAKSLIKASDSIALHQFRAVTDGVFVRRNLLQELDNGAFAAGLKRRGITLLMGECADEHFMYGTWRPPQPGYAAMQRRLEADYPRVACEALMAHYFPDGTLDTKYPSWQAAFGHIYADVQIHALERGLANALVQTGAADALYRYRIEWRAECAARKMPEGFGVTHTTDVPIWFWGNGDELLADEKRVIAEAFQEPLGRFLRGDKMQWGAAGAAQIRTLKQDGTVVIEDDGRMEEGMRLWGALKRAGAFGKVRDSKL